MTLSRTAVALPLILLVLTSALPPAIAQSEASGPSVALPEDLRDQQMEWIEALTRDLDNLTRENNLTREDVRPLLDNFNQTLRSQDIHRWKAVVGGLVVLRQETTFLVVDRAAARESQSHRVFLNASDPTFQEAVMESQALRRDIASTAEAMTTTHGLETLYLAAQLTAEGNERLRQYPLHRDLVEAGGNKTLSNFLRALIHGPTGALWNFHYARDLVDLAVEVDARGGGAPVNTSALPAAYGKMESSVRKLRPAATDSDLRAAMNATATRGEWLLATALGEAIVSTNFFTTLQMARQAEATSRGKIMRVLVEDASDLSDLTDLADAGYMGIVLGQAHVSALATVGDENAAFEALAGTAAELRGARLASASLLTLSATGPDDGGDDVKTTGADGSFPVGVAAGSLIVGVAVGAAVAVAAAARRLDDD